MPDASDNGPLTVELDIRREDGWLLLPSSLGGRFHLAFPPKLVARQDPGVGVLIKAETGHMGLPHDGAFDRATRDFIEQTLRPGDLFIDVGAHFGLFALQAATHAAGDIRVLAFEPEPANAGILFKNVLANNLADRVRVISAACGDEATLAPLVLNASMGHSIEDATKIEVPFERPTIWVPTVRLDDAEPLFKEAAGRRIVLKIDAEGYDARVIMGAAWLLLSGRVAAVIWETGPCYQRPGRQRDELKRALAWLERGRYRNFVPRDNGEMRPFDPDEAYVGNVFAIPA